jgi:hypothetical protein
MFVNGIMNSESQVSATLEQLRLLLDNSFNHPDSSKKEFFVVHVYNPTGDGQVGQCSVNAWCDIKELRASKTTEEFLFEVFPKIIFDHALLTWGEEGATAPPISAAQAISDEMIASELYTTVETVGRIQREIRLINEANHTVVLVSHSQGNLLTNLVWARTILRNPTDVTKRLRIVNVANTAAFSPNQLDLTHDKDRALQSLSLLGLKVERNTPKCSAGSSCYFTMGEAPFTVEYTGALDSLNHGILETYLSEEPALILANPGVPGVVFGTKQGLRYRLEDLIYAATNSLGSYTLK